jgi:murein DD-endopeptidase MepM/ murein hydrolase activator NlpD
MPAKGFLIKAAAIGAGFAGLGAAVLLVGIPAPPQSLSLDARLESANALQEPRLSEFEAELLPVPLSARADSAIEEEAAQPIAHVVQAKSGDTLIDLLLKSGVDRSEAQSAVEALKTVYNPRALKAGQHVTVTFNRAESGLGAGQFQGVTLNADPGRQVAARRDDDKGFAAQTVKRETTQQQVRFSGTIKSSLYETAMREGVPANTMAEMIKIMSYDVDFQRDIQAGDTFEVLMERQIDKRGQVVKTGDLLFASLTLSGQPIALYRYVDSSGDVDYYNGKGESVKKALLRTPIDGAKLTSAFGMRNHPIMGYSLMHKGVDFGAPTGTPIQAAGNGVVDEAGPKGAYGNYVRIRHNDGFSTAYAHMSRFAQGIRAGKRVSQGQIIGYVGATGRVTGAHLHYEVLADNRQVNPLSIKVPTGVKLAGKELARFQLAARDTDTRLARLPVTTKLASASR